MNILELVKNSTTPTAYRKDGREYKGPCPFCKAGTDRFTIWPDGERPRYWCRTCDQKGDTIQFCRDYLNMSYAEACAHVGQPQKPRPATAAPRTQASINTEPPAPPAEQWAERARQFVYESQDALEGSKAFEWLINRGLTEETIFTSGIGYNPAERYEPRDLWGLPPEQRKDGRRKDLWLPRGIVIPWMMDDQVVGVRIRRPAGDPLYYFISGGTSTALFGSDEMDAALPAVLVEGEFDALTIQQESRDLVNAVATGSTMGARRMKWVGRLSLLPHTLISYDNDEAGNKAAHWWIKQLGNAKRWRPYWGDVNQLAQDGVNVRRWIWQGLQIEG